MTTEIATFAGGCFWCMTIPFDEAPGIHKIVSGYTGGSEVNPTYEQVKAGETGHAEAVQITFDSEIITYEELLTIYWHQSDPTDAFGQFMDRGPSYRAEIFYHSKEQKEKAEESRDEIAKKLIDPVVTQITPAQTFYAAENYHQDFHKRKENEERLIPLEQDRHNRLAELWNGSVVNEKVN